MYRKIQILSLSIFLAACSTPEYRRNYDSCSIQAFDRYPPRLELISSQCTRDVQIDTGKNECVTTYDERSERTVCGPLLETVTETYQCDLQQDINRETRELFTRQCAAQACLKTFGNEVCDNE